MGTLTQKASYTTIIETIYKGLMNKIGTNMLKGLIS